MSGTAPLSSNDEARRSDASPRWLVILVWSTGPSALYALLGLAHAGVVERILTLDVGFGRSLSFWVVALFIALLLWGFLPRTPTGWYARRPVVLSVGVAGLLGLCVCGGYTLIWTIAHWNPGVGVPVVGSIVLVSVVAFATLWYAGREDSS